MKKLLLKLLFAILPIAIYLCIFVAFDAYDYFGFQNSTNDNNPIKRVQNFVNEPTNNIILGDSRLAHLNMDIVKESSNEEYRNLAFGGASLEESLDLFDYALEQNPNIKNVVFSLSFYTLNSNYGSVSRMSTIETQLSNPVAYVSNLEYNVNMLTNILNKLSGAPSDDDSEETRTPLEDDYTDINGNVFEYRKDLIAYASILYSKCAQSGTLPTLTYDEQGNITNLPEMLNAMLQDNSENSNWGVNEKQLSRLIETAKNCEEKGINFVVVLPPMDETVKVLLCDSLGISEQMQEVLQVLENENIKVLNYEWIDKSYPDTCFYDGFHVDTVNALPDFTKQLFSEVA